MQQRVGVLILYFLGAALTLVVILVAVILAGLHQISIQAEREHSITEKLVENLAEAKYQTVQVQQFITDSAATGEEDSQEDAAQALKAGKSAAAALKSLDSTFKQNASDLQEDLDNLYSTGIQMIKGYRVSQKEGNAIMKGVNGFDDQSEKTVKKLEELTTKVNSIRENSNQSVEDSIKKTTYFTISLTASLILIMIFSGILFRRSLFAELGAEPAVSRKLAQSLMDGDFAAPISVKSGDSTSLLFFLSGMRTRWCEILADLSNQTCLMSEQANQLNSTAQVMTENCSIQNQSASTIFRNAEELSVSIDKITNECDAANRQVMHTGKMAKETEAVLNQVTEEIQMVAKSVGQSSEQVNTLEVRTNEIVGIVAVIKGIADQTNLLALNAAIEAARAGELGKGFAVVADEVRSLARRVAESTQTITTMVTDVRAAANIMVSSIAESVNKADESVIKSRNACETMSQIGQESVAAAKQVAHINSALIEQRNSTRDIVKSLAKIAEVTDQNFATSKNVAKSADLVDQIAHTTASAIGYFHLPENIKAQRDRRV